MANYIGLVFSTLKRNGIDTRNLSTEEAIAKFNELENSGKQSEDKNSDKKEETDEKKPDDLTSKQKNDNIILDKQEYAKVAHALATKFANKSVKATYICTDKAIYYCKNVRPGNFKVVMKIDFEKYNDYLDALEDEDDK